ncbi:MAG: 50S ribosomal protein L22 [Acidobacteriota bacterium]
MLGRDIVAHARLRYLGTSAQKARLVVDLVRGKDVAEALNTLRFTRKAVAREIGRVIDSAVANARQRKQEVDVDRLYVHTAYVDGGPSLKRIRPAPMGRAFRVLKRMCHVTIGLGEHPEPAAAPPASAGAARPARPPARAGAAGRRAAAARGATGKKAAASRTKPARTKRSRSRK